MTSLKVFGQLLRASVEAGKITEHQARVEFEKRRAWQEADSPGFTPSPLASGPGVELKRLLCRIGIVATPNCACNARARRMDVEEAREPGWCEAHLDEIVGWLREEAERRKLPFLDLAARLIVRRAIANARRLSANATENTSTPRD